MYDGDTGEVLTTLFTEASQTHIQLLDYVNNLTGLDELNITFLPVKGDVNRDGTITTEDAVPALQIAGGGHSADIDLPADVNNDNRVGMEEVLYILNLLGSRKKQITSDTTWEDQTAGECNYCSPGSPGQLFRLHLARQHQ